MYIPSYPIIYAVYTYETTEDIEYLVILRQ